VKLPFARRVWSRLRDLRVDPYPWLVIAFCLFAVLPLVGPDYFFNAHDAPHSVFFLTEFDAAIRDGVWYPGWATDQALGYGYPSLVFYSPLAYYVAEGFHLLGAGMVGAVKWTWVLATVGAGLAMYAFARHVLGRRRGLLAAVVYVYVPYHLADIYVRADLREYCAFVWMPLALLAFHRLVEGVTARRIAAAGLAYGALWMTHNVTALVFTPVLACYVLYLLLRGQPAPADGQAAEAGRAGPAWSAWRPRLGGAAAALAAALLGLGLAAALLLPVLFERGFINQAQWVQAGYSYAQHFVYPFQFLSPFWGYGAAGPGPVDQMSFQIGAVPAILAMVALVGAFRKRGSERGLALFWGAATVLLLFLMMPIALPLWQAVPVAGLIQFPWRFLGLAAVALAMLAGLAVPRLEAPGPDGRVLVLALVAVVASFVYTLPQYTPVPATAEGPLLTIDFELQYPEMVGMTAWAEELPSTSPLVVQYQTGAPLVTAQALAPGAAVEMIRAGGASDELWVRSAQGTPLQFYTYYYPGWRVWVDGRREPDSALRPEGSYGLLTVKIPAGKHRVLLRWGDTPLRAAGKALTLGCLALALLLLVLPGRRSAKDR
jgi:hypothetical protein